jgi:hypothetical protein
MKHGTFSLARWVQFTLCWCIFVVSFLVIAWSTSPFNYAIQIQNPSGISGTVTQPGWVQNGLFYGNPTGVVFATGAYTNGYVSAAPGQHFNQGGDSPPLPLIAPFSPEQYSILNPVIWYTQSSDAPSGHDYSPYTPVEYVTIGLLMLPLEEQKANFTLDNGALYDQVRWYYSFPGQTNGLVSVDTNVLFYLYEVGALTTVGNEGYPISWIYNGCTCLNPVNYYWSTNGNSSGYGGSFISGYSPAFYVTFAVENPPFQTVNLTTFSVKATYSEILTNGTETIMSTNTWYPDAGDYFIAGTNNSGTAAFQVYQNQNAWLIGNPTN